MGSLERQKGKRFERRVASLAREFFEKTRDEIRRSIQSRGAEESDVVGIPLTWSECQHAKPAHHDPIGKLEQAERDRPDNSLLPAAITCVSGSGRILVTLRVAHFELLTFADRLPLPPDATIALELHDFFRLLTNALERRLTPDFPTPVRASRASPALVLRP